MHKLKISLIFLSTCSLSPQLFTKLLLLLWFFSNFRKLTKAITFNSLALPLFNIVLDIKLIAFSHICSSPKICLLKFPHTLSISLKALTCTACEFFFSLVRISSIFWNISVIISAILKSFTDDFTLNSDRFCP